MIRSYNVGTPHIIYIIIHARNLNFVSFLLREKVGRGGGIVWFWNNAFSTWPESLRETTTPQHPKGLRKLIHRWPRLLWDREWREAPTDWIERRLIGKAECRRDPVSFRTTPSHVIRPEDNQISVIILIRAR